jgi:hypothetical protein
MPSPQDQDAHLKSLELAKALTERGAPVAVNYTLPIFTESEVKVRMKVYHFGSAGLVRVAGKPFLLTAGHVLDRVVTSSDVFGLSTGKPVTQGLRLLCDPIPRTCRRGRSDRRRRNYINCDQCDRSTAQSGLHPGIANLRSVNWLTHLE